MINLQLNNKLLFISIVCLCSACTPKKEHTEDRREEPHSEKLEQQFQQWKAQQNQNTLNEYHQFIATNLTQAPSLFALAYNGHRMPKQCEQYRFAIPPKKYWNNIINSLKLLEKLNKDQYFSQYKITSTFRSPEVNECIKGAKKSKHLFNYAVDFQILDQNLQGMKEQQFTQRMCQFWKIEGRTYRMGFGIYGHNKFHIDTQGYRTWGYSYKTNTSPCLKD